MRGIPIAPFFLEDKTLTANDVIFPADPQREPVQRSTREKWLSLIALVVVSVFAAVLLHPK
ncbi:MAG TPA: hypothetical protein VME17_05630 [Bryobacteraceae bacterium]|nr:hypothetical protein [Bryobacteraceae bacterium]